MAATKALKEVGLETRLFIDGKYVEASTSARISCFSPEDDSLITDDIHKAVREDIDCAVAAARRAFPSWSCTTAAQRAEKLMKLASLIEEHADQLALLEAACNGKPLQVFHGFEKVVARDVYRYYAGWCGKLGGESFPDDDASGLLKITKRQPLGVCAAIVAFNGPIAVMAFKVAPCLAAGNTIIVKASEKSPLSSLYFGKLANEAGIPPGVINFVSGDGETGSLLAHHMQIDMISFTGSTSTGKRITEAAARSNLKKVTLELGGKSPSIIFPDADLELAVKWCVNGIAILSGQECCASSLVYVHEDIKAQVVEQMKKGFEALQGCYGDSLSQTTAFPPLVDKAQYKSVASFIEDGKANATLVTGGERLFDKGCWIQPTIFVDPLPNAKVHKEEIFGPVVVISSFTNEEEVIEWTNKSAYGLHSAVFTQDINRAMRMTERLSTGTVCVNCCAIANINVPFGGLRQSGWGRELGREGIEEYTQIKTVLIK
ncbi:aldehyde dehydrogenase domain-containing protein [Aspergillus bertholletiae]|uniref:aldehyde dehydrogenase (NAD(+)) n=1 Tax=Aspergillus bertholletiae TaxID=1226010 RepID=A0A5N7BJY3_9EURO|nr:aldehyde dehydrogenase domain-containing protein [Aspergillus bertholletiae]